MNKRVLSVITAACIAGMGAGVSVYARTISSYNLNLPAVGSVSTGKITKNNTTSGVNNISSIGGKKSVVMAIRTTKDNKDVTNKKTVSKVGRYFVDYKSASKVVGKATTLALSTPVTTIVSVHNAGSWSPDAR